MTLDDLRGPVEWDGKEKGLERGMGEKKGGGMDWN